MKSDEYQWVMKKAAMMITEAVNEISSMVIFFKETSSQKEEPYTIKRKYRTISCLKKFVYPAG